MLKQELFNQILENKRYTKKKVSELTGIELTKLWRREKNWNWNLDEITRLIKCKILTVKEATQLFFCE